MQVPHPSVLTFTPLAPRTHWHVAGIGRWEHPREANKLQVFHLLELVSRAGSTPIAALCSPDPDCSGFSGLCAFQRSHQCFSVESVPGAGTVLGVPEDRRGQQDWGPPSKCQWKSLAAAGG